MAILVENDRVRREHARYAVWLRTVAKERCLEIVARRVELLS